MQYADNKYGFDISEASKGQPCRHVLTVMYEVKLYSNVTRISTTDHLTCQPANPW
jgi:hypothetical protein